MAGLRKSTTLAEKISKKMAGKKRAVFLREDFDDLGPYDQIGRALRQLANEGKVIRIGYGLYAKTEISPVTGKPAPVLPLPRLAKEALSRLGMRTYPSRLEKAYNAGRTTQVPTGRVIAVKNRVTRKIGYNGAYISFEFV